MAPGGRRSGSPSIPASPSPNWGSRDASGRGAERQRSAPARLRRRCAVWPGNAGEGLMPRRDDLVVDPRHRVRADRHRPGLRVRLLRHPGLPRPARGGLPRRPRQLQPGDDHDRPRLRRPDVHRAAHAGGRRPDHRARAARRRAARRSAARPGSTWPWRSTGEGLIGVPGHAGDDRRQRRGDRHRRGPRAVQGGDGRHRPRRAAVGHRPHDRRGPGRRRRRRSAR